MTTKNHTSSYSKRGKKLCLTCVNYCHIHYDICEITVNKLYMKYKDHSFVYKCQHHTIKCLFISFLTARVTFKWVWSINVNGYLNFLSLSKSSTFTITPGCSCVYPLVIVSDLCSRFQWDYIFIDQQCCRCTHLCVTGLFE